MYKLILLTFGFLTWSFYEMSGGSEFEPGKVSAFRTVSTVTTEEIAPIADETVTRAETTTAELTSVAALAKPAQDPAETAEILTKSLAFAPVDRTEPVVEEVATATRVVVQERRAGVASNGLRTVPASVRGSEPAYVGPREMVRYVQPSAGGAVASDETTGDMRAISGNRVNMRNGPGTSHGVVAKLSKGDAIEVLRDNGDGWLKIRVADTGRVGWTADFLVTAAN